MKERKVSKQTKIFKKLTRGKGLYIALIALVAMVGMGIYASRLQIDKSSSLASFDESAWADAVRESGIEVVDIDNVPQTETAEDTAQEPKADSSETVKEEKPDNAAEPPSAEKTATADAEMAVAASADGDTGFAMMRPCTGAVLQKCSVDRLVYSSTMEDWRTHNGIDVAASVGDPVKAAESGTVAQVYKDGLLGITVVVDHGNGITTTYGNLQNANFIREGTQVQKGDVIGGIGQPGALEVNLEPHLHFEVAVNGEYRNPEEFISF